MGIVLGQQDDPSEIFLKAYLSAQQREKLEHENRFKTALAKYRFAGSLIERAEVAHLKDALSAADEARLTAENQRDDVQARFVAANEQVTILEHQRDEALAELQAAKGI